MLLLSCYMKLNICTDSTVLAYENTERAVLIRPEPLPPLNRRRHCWLTRGEPVLSVHPTTQLHLRFTTDRQTESTAIRHAALGSFLSRTLRTDVGPRRLNHWKEKQLHILCVFSRQVLDRGAAALGVDHIVTGHNADDIAETVLRNSTLVPSPHGKPYIGGQSSEVTSRGSVDGCTAICT